ncbi:unnamed protein product [Cyclocybe aegerita]|uniref:DUF6534 domain-containing protein n=1 Tax=Cyclocybe aegerita TaxID=1973307 RepID=A0A8S0WJJ6_CYCAE|nr:unnamed protein product [Cyclocybe aegerita]
MHDISTNLVLGPVVIGTIFNAFLYGICFLQFLSYWEYGKSNDTTIIHLLVGWTFFLDTFHTCALLYMLWVYTVVEFNNREFLSTVLWPFSATPIITTLTSFPIEFYLAWRIKLFSRSTKIFFGLLVLAAAQTSLGLACSIAAFMVPNIALYHNLIPYVVSWQVLAVAADGSITVLLWWCLTKSRIGSRRSDSVITRVIRSSIETAAFVAFFCIMDLVTFVSSRLLDSLIAWLNKV